MSKLELTRDVFLGEGIANTQLYILNGHQDPVPLGVAGEIYIGGAGVTRGYLNRPELTTEKFIADPVQSGPNCQALQDRRSGVLER